MSGYRDGPDEPDESKFRLLIQRAIEEREGAMDINPHRIADDVMLNLDPKNVVQTTYPSRPSLRSRDLRVSGGRLVEATR
jgi:hypothetical protein